MAKFNRIDAGLTVLFDIHNGQCSTLVPTSFAVSKFDLEKACGLRNMRIAKLVEEIADAMTGLGFIKACGHWSVTELEHDKVLFQSIPSVIKFMTIERGSVSFHDMTIQQVLDLSVVPSRRTVRSRLTETDCLVTYKNGHTKSDAPARMQRAKKRPNVDVEIPFNPNVKDHADVIHKFTPMPVICKHCEEVIDDADEMGVELGYHAHCKPEEVCDGCGYDKLTSCACASDFMDDDDLQPCTKGCGRPISECVCED